MLDTLFSPWPRFSAKEAAAVRRVLRSSRVNYWTGSEGRRFEQEFAAWCGSRHAVALANGTVALELALHLSGVGPGDEVVVTPRSFIASASCAVRVGARPVFADVDPDSQNITADSIAAVLTPRTKAIVCVHLAGWPCEMDEIIRLAAQRRLAVIEDCAQAHGAAYRGRLVGSLARFGAWSFCQDKVITTGGEGGMLTMRRAGDYRAAWSFKDHGKAWREFHHARRKPGFRWVHDSFGTNWRLTEMQAALGRLQLQKLPAWHAARTRNAERILAACEQFTAVRAPRPPAHVRHAWYKCYVFLRPERLAKAWDRDRILAAINAEGVPCYSGACPELYREKAFEGTRFRPQQRLPVARQLGETSLMFLVHPTLTRAEIDKTCKAIGRVLRRASR